VAQDVQYRNLTFDQLKDELSSALHDYLAETHQCEKRIMQRINRSDIFPWTRRKHYPSEREALKKEIWNLYDIEILLDAHDLSLNKNLTSLEFITGDRKDIVRNESIILATLELASIKYLSSFQSAS